MRPGNNAIETYKASRGGDGLHIREELPRMIRQGYESLTPAEKDSLKWIGVFFRKPTPGQFMMRIRMPNGFARSEQLRTIAEVSRRLGNSVLDRTTRQQVELRGFTIEMLPEYLRRERVGKFGPNSISSIGPRLTSSERSALCRFRQVPNSR